MMLNLTSPEWPALPYTEWQETRDTLHRWTQIVGKTRLALTPLVNHWWNVPLYVTPTGLTTSTIPYGPLAFDAEFDFTQHLLRIRTSTGSVLTIALYARSVADFYAEYRTALSSLGIDVKLYTTPCEVPDTTPFDKDVHHASYDKIYVERFHTILLNTDRLFKEFRSTFMGKSSPVHFFWGSFDLAVTRFSRRPAPQQAAADRITREAYSHEVSSCGFWPGDSRYPKPAFYAYAAPTPAGFAEQRITPEAALWNADLGEFLLNYEDVRHSLTSEGDIMDFIQSTYSAVATLGQWDRKSLERTTLV